MPKIGFFANGFFGISHLFMSDARNKVAPLRKACCAVRHTSVSDMLTIFVANSVTFSALDH